VKNGLGLLLSVKEKEKGEIARGGAATVKGKEENIV
jgi:hypothetical protein